MNCPSIVLLIALFFPFCSQAQESQGVEEVRCFILCDPRSGESIEIDNEPLIKERVSPCCSFNIALALMGFDTGIITDAETPSWVRQEEDQECPWVEPQEGPISPLQWMRQSCVWYSQMLARELGSSLIQNYLERLGYGNLDMTGNPDQGDGSSHAWLSSSLKIAPQEQVQFLNRLVSNELPITSTAVEGTKAILFIEELPWGWKLYGKTGSGTHQTPEGSVKMGWFIGWVEREGVARTFVCHCRSSDPSFVGGRVARASTRERLFRWAADQPSLVPQSNPMSMRAGS
jgi:beta-lactamase class D